MEFVLTFQQPSEASETHVDPLKEAPVMHAWKLYMESMGSAGVMRGGNKLDARNSTSIRVRGGKRQIQDGPFADTKDLLAGYVVIDVPNLDDALKWAELSPSSSIGSTEVWPVMNVS